jgi:SAM-dependent methyltransferase
MNQTRPRPSRARMSDYYENKLSAEGLRKCYEIAPPRIRQYLNAEATFVTRSIEGSSEVLELGCGYGRVLRPMALRVRSVVGCDTSQRSLRLAQKNMHPLRNVSLLRTDASCLPFRQEAFDAVFCIQNGICAFGADRQRLVEEAMRVTRTGGLLLFSSYSSKIWKDRLAWFREQSRAGLIGEIDEALTKNGTIVCKDGFRATTVRATEFTRLFLKAGTRPHVLEIDGSSLFCLARK